jgi:hypothetical protein
MIHPQLLSLTAVLLLISLGPIHGGETLGIQQVISNMKPYTGKHHAGVDTTTLKGKVMCGYQGWFAAEGDGSGRGWTHYGAGNNGLKPGHCTFDLWPDMREMDKDEKFATAFKHKDGSPAYLFSPYQPKTVLRHFKWMKDSGIDGIFLQRFASSTKSAKSLNHRNVVTANVQAGANQYGRTWALMYDLSGLKKGDIENTSLRIGDGWLIGWKSRRTNPTSIIKVDRWSLFGGSVLKTEGTTRSLNVSSW